MSDEDAEREAPKPRQRRSLTKRLRLRLRRLIRHDRAMRLLAFLVEQALTVIVATQSRLAPRTESDAALRRHGPVIVGCWHGQHLLAPFFRPKDMRFVALLSKNADAEVNARVVERLGVETVRGSGGRVPGKTLEKGGARALIALRRRMAEGASVFMIADVSKATPRQAGLGIVTLAKISGRPIMPCAATTSRRHVVRRSWDKTTIPLPFGRMAVVVGDPIFVPADADAALLEEKRREVTAAIEGANRRALELVSAEMAA
ncbi:hypothetical protein GCM10011390_18050 [Aureimonas endophytica]|uniref:DUF374 domain-containing protein n=1 Tax=Aureimonas endophytica TaxID=2027858 RepID=A0A916ZIJ1_9HYPH|nr:lysophospholipid acyltransferase family protein [Aureimonas endophytica]GGD99625.1 hypothetical protein GCM10011390_18050 [Aureimonas endophytica]